MNWDIIGHEWAVNQLREHVAQNRLRHAYLITGPQGLGKRTLALHLAQAAICTQPPAPGEPCGVCANCRRLAKMQHPDLNVIQPELTGGTLKVDQIRDLQHTLSLSPYEAAYRIALLLHFENAHSSAANALLKTLEEPGPKVLLILTADSPESLLPTVVSRCEVLRLAPVHLKTLSQGLQTQYRLDAERANLLAHLSGGRPGLALTYNQQPELLDQRNNWLDEHLSLLASNRIDRFAYAEASTKDPKEREMPRQMLRVWLSLWRDVMLESTGASTPLVNYDRANAVHQIARLLNRDRARQAVMGIERTLGLLDMNVNTRLALEVLMLDLPLIKQDLRR